MIYNSYPFLNNAVAHIIAFYELNYITLEKWQKLYNHIF